MSKIDSSILIYTAKGCDLHANARATETQA